MPIHNAQAAPYFSRVDTTSIYNSSPSAALHPDAQTHLHLSERFMAHARSVLAQGKAKIPVLLHPRARRARLRYLSQFELSTKESDGREQTIQELLSAQRFDPSTLAHLPSPRLLELRAVRPRWFGLARHESARVILRILTSNTDLASGISPAPVSVGTLSAEIDSALQSRPVQSRAPLTLLLFSPSGFSEQARQLATIRSDLRLILAEPEYEPALLSPQSHTEKSHTEKSHTGGWIITGSSESRIFDPESPADRRKRLKARSGSRTAPPVLPHQSSAKPSPHSSPASSAPANNTPPNAASAPASAQWTQTAKAVVNKAVTKARLWLDPNEALRVRLGQLQQQNTDLQNARDTLQQDIVRAESQEFSLRQAFANTSEPVTRKRLAAEVSQLRADQLRRQQLLGVLNQQLQVLGTHVHNLRLAQTTTPAGLPKYKDISQAARKAEDALAELQAAAELSSIPSGDLAPTSDAQRVYQELTEFSISQSPVASEKRPDQPPAAPSPAAPLKTSSFQPVPA